MIDETGHILLIRRTRPGLTPYWTTPGGGLEPSDESLTTALHREVAEELGTRITSPTQVFLHSSITGAGIDIQHYFLAQPHGLSVHHRGAPELDDLSRGGYDLDRVDLTSNRLSEIDLRPRELKDFILTNRRALVIDAAAMI